MLNDAMRQRYTMIEHDPRDEKWAEWHIHPQTYAEIMHYDGRRASMGVPYLPAIEQPYRPGGDQMLIGYKVRVTTAVEPGRIHLSHETDLEAGVRHLTDSGHVVNIVKSPPLVFDKTPPPDPTVKALVKHWLRKAKRS